MFIMIALAVAMRHFAPVGAETETMTIAAGCYWSPELVYQRIPGVLHTSVGFCGGHGKKSENPVYPASGTGHTEAVQVNFDPTVVSYSDLLDVFWNVHDPFNADCQGPDCGPSYRSAIWWHSESQRAEIERTRRALEEAKGRKVATEIGAMDNNRLSLRAPH